MNSPFEREKSCKLREVHNCLKFVFSRPSISFSVSSPTFRVPALLLLGRPKKNLQPKKCACNAYVPKLNPSHEHALAFPPQPKIAPPHEFPLRGNARGGGKAISENKKKERRTPFFLFIASEKRAISSLHVPYHMIVHLEQILLNRILLRR